MFSKKAFTPTSWSLLSKKVTEARIESHRIHQLLSKALKVLESLPPEERERVFQLIGDLIQDVPSRIESLESNLDTLGYALASIGKDSLRERLTVSDRALVESSLEPVADLMPLKVALLYVKKKAQKR